VRLTHCPHIDGLGFQPATFPTVRSQQRTSTRSWAAMSKN